MTNETLISTVDAATDAVENHCAFSRLLMAASRSRQLDFTKVTVLLAVYQHCLKGTVQCIVDVEEIAEVLNIAPKRVQKCLDTLCNFGFLSIKPVQGWDPIYTVHIPPGPLEPWGS